MSILEEVAEQTIFPPFIPITRYRLTIINTSTTQHTNNQLCKP